MDWDKYNAAEADGVATGSSQDMLFDDVQVDVELTAVDRYMVEHSFTGNHIAGDEVTYKFNRYGQLGGSVRGWALKGGSWKGILKALSTNPKWFTPLEELEVAAQWTLVRGVLFPNGSKIPVGLLCRGDVIIGVYKKGTNVGSTIKWFEQKIYKTNAWRNMQTHKLRDYKPEVLNEVYQKQTPMFTREEELEEITAFIDSLRNRILGNEETQILRDLRDVIDNILD